MLVVVFLLKKRFPSCEDNELDLDTVCAWLSCDDLWNFSFDITNLGSTLSTLGELITLESMAEMLLGMPPPYWSTHDEDSDEPTLPL